MSTVLDVVKELYAKVPNLEELLRQVKKTPGRPVADVAYVYNGYDDLELTHLGVYSYVFPAGQVTKVETLQHREIDQNKSGDGNIAWQTITLKGESVARELIETRGFTEKGLAVFIDGPEVPAELKAECDEKGDRYIHTEIERFKVGRDKAKAGVAGYKLKPDPRTYRWMKRLTPDDELFADQSRRSDMASSTAAAVSRLTDIVSTLVEERNAKAAKTAPRRKSFESEEDFEKRKLAWEEEQTRPGA